MGVVVFFIFCNLIYLSCAVNLNIKNVGQLIGSTTQTAWTDQTVFQFLAIRFAEPPSGSLRFKPPVAIKQWPSIQNVQNYGRPCPVLKYIAEMPIDEQEDNLEDCLHLSVYTKNISAQHPVMFYIHGGAFENGAAYQFPPNYLLEKNVVLVVPQYRLGPLGFLSTQSDEIPGSAALLDLILALEWTQEYIEHFGGDPSRVTLFGHSAGGAIASALLFSPHVSVNNLFHRVIIQSGSMLSTRAFDMNPYRNAKDMAQYFCYITDTLADVNHCLMNMNVIDLLKAYQMHGRKHKMALGLHQFGGAKLTFNQLLPKTPNELIRESGAIKNIPLMAGVTKHDGSFILAMVIDWLKEHHGDDYEDQFTYDHLEQIIQFLGLSEQTGLLTGLIANTFFSPEHLTDGKISDAIKELIDISGAITLKSPVFKIVQTQAKHYPHQTYLYSLDYHGEFPYREDMSFFANTDGVHHYSDVRYLFPLTLFDKIDNDADRRISRKMVDLWTSFAETGVPSSEMVPEWPSLTNRIGPYLRIDNVSHVGTNFLDEYSVASLKSKKDENIDKTDDNSFLMLLACGVVIILIIKK